MYTKGGEGKGKERRAYAYVNVARRPSVRKSHWPFRKITWTAKLPRNIATPRVIGEWKREARRGENQWTIARRVNFPTILWILLFFFFFLSIVVNSSSLLVRHVTFVTRGIIMVDNNCYEQLVKWLRIDERRNCESSWDKEVWFFFFDSIMKI